MNDRIKFFINFNKITAAQLADSLNIQRSRLSHILSGRNKPNVEFIQKMLGTYKDLNPFWLILGQGNMFKEDGVNENYPTRPKSQKKDVNLKAKQKIQSPTLFDQKLKKIRKIDKIVIFYSDKSFENYTPEINDF